MKTLLLFFSGLLITNIAWCQAGLKGNNKKITFSSVSSIGVLSGSNGEAPVLQTINGLRKDKWSAGIGAGIDYYYYRSVPLFLSLRRDLFANKNTPFIYADGGVNFPWVTNSEKNMMGAAIYKKGLYYEGGLGWKVKVKNDVAVTFSAGYSYKQLKEEVNQMWWWGPPMPTAETPKDRYDYRLNRLVIKMGFQL